MISFILLFWTNYTKTTLTLFNKLRGINDAFSFCHIYTFVFLIVSKKMEEIFYQPACVSKPHDEPTGENGLRPAFSSLVK